MRSEKELIQLLLDSEEFTNKYESPRLWMLLSKCIDNETTTSDEGDLLFELILKTNPNVSDLWTMFESPNILYWQPRKEYLENLLKKYE